MIAALISEQTAAVITHVCNGYLVAAIAAKMVIATAVVILVIEL